MVQSREEAEDLVQEVYIRVLKSYSKFEKRSSEKTWIYAIARNLAMDSFRKQKGSSGDLVQEVYIRVLKSYSKFEKRSSEKTWIYAIARNLAMDSFRKQKGSS